MAVRFEATDDAQVWDMVGYFCEYLVMMLSERDGHAYLKKVHADDLAQSSIERDSVAALRRAIHQHHFVPDHVVANVGFMKGAPPSAIASRSKRQSYQLRRALSPDLAVTVWGNFATREFTPSIHVELEGSDKILVDGVHANVSREHERLQADGLPALRSSAVEVGLSAEPPTTSTDRPHEGPGTWVRHTWRDHAASFSVTVIGGLAVVVLAVLLGFQGG